MTQSLVGETALVTGGARRIGRSIVLALASSGADVVIHYHCSDAAACMLAGEVEALGRRAWTVPADLSDVSACEALMATAWRETGGLSLLINNASCFDRKPLLACEASDFADQWQVNTLAPMLLTCAFARRRVAVAGADGATGPTGHIINLLDRRIATHEAGCLPYLVSKKALQAFTESAALELAPGIAVNAVAPGAILPPPSGVTSEPAGAAPLATLCRPEDVARAVVWLAGSPTMTGQTIYIDAGQHLVSRP